MRTVLETIDMLETKDIGMIALFRVLTVLYLLFSLLVKLSNHCEQDAERRTTKVCRITRSLYDSALKSCFGAGVPHTGM